MDEVLCIYNIVGFGICILSEYKIMHVENKVIIIVDTQSDILLGNKTSLSCYVTSPHPSAPPPIKPDSSWTKNQFVTSQHTPSHLLTFQCSRQDIIVWHHMV